MKLHTYETELVMVPRREAEYLHALYEATVTEAERQAEKFKQPEEGSNGKRREEPNGRIAIDVDAA